MRTIRAQLVLPPAHIFSLLVLFEIEQVMHSPSVVVLGDPDLNILVLTALNELLHLLRKDILSQSFVSLFQILCVYMHNFVSLFPIHISVCVCVFVCEYVCLSVCVCVSMCVRGSKAIVTDILAYTYMYIVLSLKY